MFTTFYQFIIKFNFFCSNINLYSYYNHVDKGKEQIRKIDYFSHL